MTADAAIIALPTLAVTAGAVRAAQASFTLAAEQGAALPVSLLLPTIAALAFVATWAVYYALVGLLAYRALSTSNSVVLFLVLTALLTVLGLLNQPILVPPMLSAAAGATVALRLLRFRPRRLFRTN